MQNLICYTYFHFQHKEFEEIERQLQRRGPLNLGSVSAQKSIRQPPVEVISEPSSDLDNDPHEDVHKQLKAHQVSQHTLSLLYQMIFLLSLFFNTMHEVTHYFPMACLR